MNDTEGGSEVHLTSVAAPRKVARGEEIVLTIREAAPGGPDSHIAVSFAGFIEDVIPGDVIAIGKASSFLSSFLLHGRAPAGGRLFLVILPLPFHPL